MLAKDVGRVAEFLCPGGKREGSEYRCGSVQGGAGDSLGVHLTGAKAGVWKDFSSDDKGGDLIGLWMQARGVSLRDAMREAADFLGVQEPTFQAHQPKEYRKPTVTHKPAEGKVSAYLASRGLTAETLRAFKVRASDDGEDILLPYLRGTELLNAKWLRVDRPQGKKIMRMETDCEPLLFGWQCVPADAREVVLCEGEIDAMSAYQLGMPALSVPNGASGMQWVETEYPNLDRFDVIYVAFDEDEAGRKGSALVAERLGTDRCRVVALPANDVNEALCAGMDSAGFAACIKASKSIDPPELRSAADYADDVVREFYPPEGEFVGIPTPWPSLHGKLIFRPSEVVILNGINGHGKSQVLGHLMLEAMHRNERVCIASLEMPVAKWLRRLTNQAGAVREPSIPYIRAISKWYGDKLWAFDRVGTADTNRLIEVFTYARRRYGISVFAIDSLAKCGIADDDYGAQKLWVEKLCDFAIQHKAIVFLITHSRKLESEHERADKMDVKGSGSITDLACTLLNVWRNKRKEEKPEELKDEADVILSCQKQRYGDWEGRKWLWFDTASFQFLDSPQQRPEPYVPFARPILVSSVAGGMGNG
jgi:twinkle protein